jgi:hypothetical protein
MLLCAPVSAQQDAPATAFEWSRTAPYRRAPLQPQQPDGRAALLSAVVPGTGQLLLRQRRGWAYLALEALGWTFWIERRSAAGDLVDEYRDFAWDRARIQSGARVDGDFDYYETLTKWTRSGAFDADAGLAGLQPEADPATFNGMIWQRAVAIYLPEGQATPSGDPGWERAREYYRARAYGTELLWDWTGTGDAQDSYADILSDSDAKYRQATNILGAVIANHLVSAADAWLSGRGVPTPAEVRFAPDLVPNGRARWHARVRVEVGR